MIGPSTINQSSIGRSAMRRFNSLPLAMLCLALVAGLARSALGFGFTDESQLPHKGVVGKPFTVELLARNGSFPYSYHIDSGSLPPGVTMSSNGLIAGIPTKAGTYKFWCDAKDGYVNPMHSQRQIILIIEEPNASNATADKAAEPSGNSDNWVKPGWHLTFHDEFNGKSVDLRHFVPRFDDHPLMPANFFASDGIGHLRMDRHAPTTRPDAPGRVSALETRHAHNAFAQQYGWFEVRARGTAGSGLGSGCWLLPLDKKYAKLTTDGGSRASADEPTAIDVFEFFGKATHANNFSVHFGAGKNDEATETKHMEFPFDFTRDFHVYALEWTPDQLIWYVDGKEVQRSNNVPKTPFFLRLALFEGDIIWRGPVDSSHYPADFDIDYVRVYSKAENP
jgi:hypothetical protein